MSKDMQRISTGTSGLDKMLNGGLFPGGIYTVAGPPGTGKTIMGTQFLLEGVKLGEAVLFVALDEAPAEIRENLRPMFGMNFDKILVLDGTLEMKSYEKTPLKDVSITRRAEAFGKVFPEIPRSADLRNPELTVNAIQEMIKAEVRQKKITRMLIDSIISLKYFMMNTSDRNQFMQSFLRFASDLDITVMMTVQEENLPKYDSAEIEFVMSRGVIRFHRWLQNNGFRLGVSIDKYRGSDHDETVRRIKITPMGFQVLERHARLQGGR